PGGGPITIDGYGGACVLDTNRILTITHNVGSYPGFARCALAADGSLSYLSGFGGDTTWTAFAPLADGTVIGVRGVNLFQFSPGSTTPQAPTVTVAVFDGFNLIVRSTRNADQLILHQQNGQVSIDGVKILNNKSQLVD